MNDTPHAHEKTGLFTGKRVIVALMLTVALLPLPVLMTSHWVRRSLEISDKPLDWTQHATWSMPPVKHTTMEQPISNYKPSGSQPKWRTTDLFVIPLVEKTLQQCADLARLPKDEFVADEVRDQLQAILDRFPKNPNLFFYPRYLLGQWYRLNDQPQQADIHFTQAFAHTPSVLMVPYVNTAGQPMAGLDIGTLVMSIDRSDGKTVDQTLKLVYPYQTTDETGRLYLPVYDTILRFSDLPTPPGYRCQYGKYQWFEFPGRLAALRPTVVWRGDEIIP